MTFLKDAAPFLLRIDGQIPPMTFSGSSDTENF